MMGELVLGEALVQVFVVVVVVERPLVQVLEEALAPLRSTCRCNHCSTIGCSRRDHRNRKPHTAGHQPCMSVLVLGEALSVLVLGEALAPLRSTGRWEPHIRCNQCSAIGCSRRDHRKSVPHTSRHQPCMSVLVLGQALAPFRSTGRWERRLRCNQCSAIHCSRRDHRKRQAHNCRHQPCMSVQVLGKALVPLRSTDQMSN